ncbi:MAG: metallophosphoesterase [Candidatus Aminicenantes bacterium]|nr:MAG: metallophosphoesterase [Candidatus Aminicenantes bacterium]
MKKISRRGFLKSAAALGAGVAVNPADPFPAPKPNQGENLQDRLFISDYPFGYDPEYFEATERIFFEEHNRAYINLFIKPTQSLDIRLYMAETKDALYKKKPLQLFALSNSLDISLGKISSPELHYKVEYLDGKSWKSLPERSVKTPNFSLESGRTFRVILKGDDHVYADLKHQPEDPHWRKEILRGDYISSMLKEIITDPYYTPDIPLYNVIYGFTLAHTLKYILEIEPDLVIDLGDTVGQDSYPIWGTEGEWEELLAKDALNVQSKILWERKRRTLNAIAPEIPYYQVLGNHDGETGWFTDTQPFTQPYAQVQRKRCFKQPEALRLIERMKVNSGVKDGWYSNDDWLFKNANQNYFPIFWGNGEIRFYLLDVNSFLLNKPKTIYDWTLGPRQKDMVESMLFDGQSSPWKFICYHNVLGGYPLGSQKIAGAYGRGPLFTREDYERINRINPSLYIDLDRVEQVWLTELARETDVRGFFYAHDHIFFAKNIGQTKWGKKMMGVCAGATTYSGSGVYDNIWSNPYWMDYYGDLYELPSTFLTPPGITVMDIDKTGATIKYVCTAPPEIMFANMPEGTKIGDVLREYWISR